MGSIDTVVFPSERPGKQAGGLLKAPGNVVSAAPEKAGESFWRSADQAALERVTAEAGEHVGKRCLKATKNPALRPGS